MKFILDVDECSGNPCQNGATCSMPKFDMYSCQCVAGYTGTNCETGNHALQKLLPISFTYAVIIQF